jgi:homoserine dehydrogenase
MTLRVGVLGCGVVGGGLIELLSQRGEQLGLSLQRVAVRDQTRPRREVPHGVPIGTVEEVIRDDAIDVVVELIGGLDHAYAAIRQALERKKAVVTANKAVVSAHGDELRALAAHVQVGFRYEASVAGCLPIVEILENDLIFDRVDRLIGILNGTCNFILSRCSQGSLQYAEALREAQLNGFAEADPTLDVSGADTAQKLAILVTLLSGGSCAPERVSTTGIDSIAKEDHLAAEELGYVIKLLALYRRGDRHQVRVAPTLVPKSSAVGLTVEEYNAVEVECSHIGWQLYLGKGAGRMPTASAVLHDLVRIREGAARVSRSNAPLTLASPGSWTAPWLLRIPREISVASLGARLAGTGVDVSELRRSKHDSVGTLILTQEASADAIAKAQDALTVDNPASSRPVAFAVEPEA